MTETPQPGCYEHLDFNAPLSAARAEAVARSLTRDRPADVLDVGCGWGRLLLLTVAATDTATGRGVDSDPELLERARADACGRGLGDRVSFTETNLPAPLEPADAVICVGADHAFGGQSEALRALRELVRPGGRLLFGTGFWERVPSAEQAGVLDETPESLPDLAGLVDLATAEGLRPLGVQTANRDEWERFESGFLADWEEWLLRYGHLPGADAVRRKADGHRDRWLRGYRDVLGFAYLTLGRPAG